MSIWTSATLGLEFILILFFGKYAILEIRGQKLILVGS
jgi:hypothetical protein